MVVFCDGDEVFVEERGRIRRNAADRSLRDDETYAAKTLKKFVGTGLTLDVYTLLICGRMDVRS